jgi:hypothetical protein
MLGTSVIAMNRRWTHEDEQKLIALRESGEPWRVVAWKLGRTEAATVSHALAMKSRRRPDGNADADGSGDDDGAGQHGSASAPLAVTGRHSTKS